MPELPEVETIKRTLEPLTIGRKIIAVQLIRDSVIKHPDAEEFAKLLTGRVIDHLGRRGKYLLLHLDGDYTLAVHLRMTGHFLCCAAATEPEKHTHVVFDLDDGQQLRFADMRRFGCLWLLAPGESDDFTGMQKLGVEPLTSDFCAAYLQERLAGRHIAIKQGLLDQTVVAGLGNIYVDEALFAASIDPRRRPAELSDAQWCKLAEVIPCILEQSIADKGTTFSDYVDGEGKRGYHSVNLAVYGRGGQSCVRCGQPLEKIKIAGRGTVYCPHCQK